MWIEWLKDELNLIDTSSAERDDASVIALFETALQDYHYRKVYKLYLKYLISSAKENEDAVFEKAVSIWGVDLDKGDAFWQLYADYCAEKNP